MRPRSLLHLAHDFSPALVAVGAALALVAAPAAAAPRSDAGGPRIYLQAGQALAVEHRGPDRVRQRLASGQAEPLSLAQGDFQEQGIPGMVVGYATPEGGLLAVHEGNLDAFAPQGQPSWEAIRDGNFPSPFLPQAGVFAAPARPDFLASGSFAGQGHVDLVMAARGGSQLYVLPGNGRGRFDAAIAIPVPGTITALGAGMLGPGSPWTTVVVGVQADAGSSLLVFRGSPAGLAEVARLAVAGRPTQVAFGNLGAGGGSAAAVVADGQVFLLDGDATGGALALRPSGLPLNTVVAIAAGRFSFDRSPRQQLALLASDGSVHIAARAGLDARPWTAAEVKQMLARRGRPGPLPRRPASPGTEAWQVVETLAGAAPFGDTNPPLLLRGRISSRGADDVIVIDGEAAQIVVISHPDLQAGATAYGPGELSVLPYAAGRPVAGLVMRVNADARPGLVVLHREEVAPRVAMPLPDPTFTVNTTADVIVANACANNVAGSCSLREAVIEANASPGADTIMVPAGTYTLTIPPNGQNNATGGHLDINDGLTIVGTANGDGTPGTIIQAGTSAGNGIDKVFSIAAPTASGLRASFATSMSNVVCQNGVNSAANGDTNDPVGGCFDADAGAAGTGSVALTNVAVLNNSTVIPMVGASGGGIAFFTEVAASGVVTICQSIIKGNSTADAGGGIFVGSSVPLVLSNSQVLNNQAVGGGGQQGGGIAILGPSGSTQSAIHASLVSGNQAGSQGGGIYTTAGLDLDQGTIVTQNTASGSGAQTGGGLWSNTTNETTTITNVTFTGNDGATSGGAIQVDGSTQGNALNVVFSRIAGNTSPQGSGLNNVAGTVIATDDWWGCGQGPATSPCDQATGVNGSTTTTSPWVTLSFVPAAGTINDGASTTLTASLLQDSQGNPIAVGNLAPILSVPALPSPVPGGLPVPIPVSFGSAVNGNLTNEQPSIQPAGTATATFTATAGGTGQATATVDGGSATASIAIQDFTIAITPAAQNVILGNTATLTLTVTPLGGFTGTVNITSCGISPAGPVLGGCPGSLTITSTSGAVSATLTVVTSTANTATNYTVSAAGSSGTLPPHAASAQLVAQDFALSISPSSQSLQAGQNAAFTVTCSAANGFSGPVQLGASIEGATVTFNSNPLNCPGQTGFTVGTSTATPSGSYVVLGSSGGASRASAGFALAVSQACTQSIWEWTNTPPPAEGSWTGQAVSEAEFCSDFHALLDGTGATHVYALNNVSHLVELFQPSVGAAFQRIDVSAATGTAVSGIPNNLLLANTSQGIDVFALSGGHLMLFATSGNSHTYQVSDVSALAGGSTSLKGASSPIEFGSTVHVYVADSGGSLHDFVKTASAQWQDVNLSAQFGNSPGTAPAVFAYGGNSLQVMATGAGNHLVLFVESVNADGTISGFQFHGDLTSMAGYPSGVCSSSAIPAVFLVGPQGNDVSSWLSDGNGKLVDYVKPPTTNWTVQNATTPEPGGCTSPTALYFSNQGANGTVKVFVQSSSSQLVEYTGDPVTGAVSGANVASAVSSDAVALFNGQVFPSPQGTMELFALSTPLPDFSVTAAPASQAVACGCTDFTVAVSSQDGFGGSVALSASGLPAGASATFSPTAISGVGESTLSICTTASTPAASSTVTITAAGGSLSHTAAVTLAVTDFSIAATSSQTVNAGANAGYTVTTTAQNGFAAPVSLTVTGLPAGATASFNPAVIGGAGSATLTVATSASTPVGNYTLTITGGSGCRTHTATATLAVNAAAADFKLWATPALQASSNGSYTVFTSPMNGFSNNVSLSISGLPTGATASFSPAAISGGSGSSTASVTCPASTAAGTYPLTITGASGGLAHSTTVNLVVNGPANFSLAAAAPTSQTVPPGGAASYTVSAAAQNGFSGKIALSVVGLPARAAATLNPTSINGSGTATVAVTTAAATPAGTYTITITGGSGSLSHSTTVSLVVSGAASFSLAASAPTSQTVSAGGSATYTVATSAQGGFSGSVALSASGLPAGASASFSPSSISGAGSSTVTVATTSATPVGTYTLTVSGASGILTRSTTVTLVVNTAAPPPPSTLRPTVFTSPGTPYANPANAADGNLGTFANGIVNGQTSIEYWQGFGSAGKSPTRITLNVSSAADCTDPGGEDDGAELAYSLDGGNTFHHIYAQGTLGADACTNRTQQTDVVSLPLTQDTTKVQVFAELSSILGSTHQIYDIWIQVSY
jgi:CSLREA domain-containing protein